MKPKPRGKGNRGLEEAKISPQHSPAASSRPQVKRRRVASVAESSSPDRKCSSSSNGISAESEKHCDAAAETEPSALSVHTTTNGVHETKEVEATVVPPPEYPPYRYTDICTHLIAATSRTEDSPRDRDEITELQHELEGMLTHAVDFLRRSHGDLTFLNTGDYPTIDLRKRTMPVYEKRRHSSQSPNAKDEVIARTSIIPPEEAEESIDTWPPAHIPTRFWSWVKAEIEKPNVDFLAQFKKEALDLISASPAQEPLVSELYPQRHLTRRRTDSGLLRRSVNSLRPISRRKLSCSGVQSCENGEPCTSTPSTSKGTTHSSASETFEEVDCENMMCLFDEMLAAYMKEMLQQSRAATRAAATAVKAAYTMNGHAQASLHLTNGYHPNNHSSYCNGYIPERKVKYEQAEDEYPEEKPIRNGFTLNGYSHHKQIQTPKNGEIRRNGEHKKWQSPITTEKVEEASQTDEDEEDERIRAIVLELEYDEKLTLSELVTTVVFQRPRLPSEHQDSPRCQSTKHACSKTEVKREPSDQQDSQLVLNDVDSDTDEVSAELMRAEDELEEAEHDAQIILDEAYERLVGDVAYCEAMQHLDGLEDELFTLYTRFYREIPRRQPNSTELPVLAHALTAHRAAAEQAYGSIWKPRGPVNSEHPAFLSAVYDDHASLPPEETRAPVCGKLCRVQELKRIEPESK